MNANLSANYQSLHVRVADISPFPRYITPSNGPNRLAYLGVHLTIGQHANVLRERPNHHRLLAHRQGRFRTELNRVRVVVVVVMSAGGGGGGGDTPGACISDTSQHTISLYIYVRAHIYVFFVAGTRSSCTSESWCR